MNAYDIKTGTPVPRQKNPVREDSWLMPGGCTEIEPPEFNQDTHVCSFDGNEWILTAKPEPEPEPEPYVLTYADKRLNEYGKTKEQIEFITENGLEAWQARVASIKEKYPKK
tara:strand:- start:1590 stop:1925 length:336 start_codon:yes stop_codon:yes gene_type:complete